MERGRHFTKQEKQELSLGGRRLAMSLLSVLFVVYAFLVFSIAWFSQSKLISARNMRLETAGISTMDFTLYEWTGATANDPDGAWVTRAEMNLLYAVPNETRRYMITCNNAIHTVGLTLSAQTVVGVNGADENLYDYVYLDKIDEGGFEEVEGVPVFHYTGGTVPPYLKATAGTEPITAPNVTISVDDQNSVVFDVHLSKHVCDYFDGWGISGVIIVS